MIEYAGPENVREEERLRREVRLPTARKAEGGRPCDLRISLDDRFDIAALRGLRRILADAADIDHLQLDFSAVRLLDAAALHLLVDDLVGIEARGTSVAVSALPAGIAERLLHHPLRRFSAGTDPQTDGSVDAARPDEDELFTDPDRDRPGFLHSDR